MEISGKNIGVIGAGIAGLAIAIRLACKGYDVTIFEANAAAGGKIGEFRQDGFRFDTGPTLITMPQYIDELFQIAGKDPKDYISFKQLDPIIQYFFEDGTVVRTSSNMTKLIAELTEKTNVRKEALEEYFRRCANKYELTDKVFLKRSLHQWKNYFDAATLKGILKFDKIGAFTTMAKANVELLKDEKVTQIFNHYASYNGSDPYSAPATLNIIAHYEIALGSYYPLGGIHKIPEVLTNLAQECGVKFKFNSKVEELEIDNGRVRGLRVGGQQFLFNKIIANSDIQYLYSDLIPKQKKPVRTLNEPRSSSYIVFFWGMNRSFPDLALHNMFMSSSPKEEYDRIFSNSEPINDPTVYLHIGSKENEHDAPGNCENWMLHVPVPYNSGQNWRSLTNLTRKRVIEKINRILKTDIGPHIQFRSHLDPFMFEQQTSTAFGAVYGSSSNSKISSFLRHPNFSKRIKNLYFCGGTVHPGSGIPLCLLSAKITAGIIGDFGSG